MVDESESGRVMTILKNYQEIGLIYRYRNPGGYDRIRTKEICQINLMTGPG
jgi:hypothetical protein